MEAEKRKNIRRRSLIRVKAVSADGHRLVDCVIRDISDTGAFLKSDAPESIPREGYLRFHDGRPDVSYRVKHGRSDGVGINFASRTPAQSNDVSVTPKVETEPLSFSEAAKQRLRERFAAKTH